MLVVVTLIICADDMLQYISLLCAETNRAVADGINKLVKEEGARAAYKGLTPTVLALLPSWAIYFPVYEHMKRKLAGVALHQPCRCLLGASRFPMRLFCVMCRGTLGRSRVVVGMGNVATFCAHLVPRIQSLWCLCDAQLAVGIMPAALRLTRSRLLRQHSSFVSGMVLVSH